MVTLKIGSTPSILKQLKKDEIQIALVEGEVEGGEYKVNRFAEDEVMVVCSANHKWKDWEKVCIEEVMAEKIIWREENSGIRIVVEDILKNIQVFEQLKIYMEFGSTQAIKGAVEENLGISILSKLTLEKEIREGSLKALSIEGIDFKTCGSYRKKSILQRDWSKSSVIIYFSESGLIKRFGHIYHFRVDFILFLFLSISAMKYIIWNVLCP